MAELKKAYPRKCIYVHDALGIFIKLVDKSEFSRTLNMALAHYMRICREYRPSFNSEEWALIGHALQNVAFDNPMLICPEIVSNMIRLNSDERVFPEELICDVFNKVKNISMAEIASIFYEVKIGIKA